VVGSLAKSDPLGVTHIGKYQLVRRVATGGMAEIFLARAKSIQGFEKLVVLKRILPQHAESEEFIQMFLAEARLAAALHHPNIVQVYDIGQEHGAFFFSMEYVQGQDLRTIVRSARKLKRAIPIEHILHIVMGVAGGLHHAHEMVGHDGKPLGIVHRDVSPSNVLVTYGGDVKLVDFGIAKAASAQVATIAGTLKGKIPYMSPEQCRGEPVDRRSDIFSIGTLLWELTTGRRLFSGDNEFAVLNRVAKGEVPKPSSVRPDYPEALEAIAMKALSAEPRGRYTTAQQMLIDLEDFAREYRLPVSSARMGLFMGELFEAEIKAAQRELAADSAEDTGDYTPSEMRSRGDRPAGLAGATRTTVDLDVRPISAPGRRGRIALGIATGLLTAVVGGIVGLLALEPPAAVEPARVPPSLEAPPVAVGTPEPVVPVEPAPVVVPAEPGTATSQAPAAPSAVDPSPAVVEPAVVDPSVKKPTPRTPRRRPSTPRSDRGSASPHKTEYDPDSALPPGV